MKKCVNCNVEYADDVNFCPKCGGALQPCKPTCAACGAELEDGANFCPKCGARVADPNVCAACGAELAEGNNFCPKCGAARGSSVAASSPAPAANTAAPAKKSGKSFGATVADVKNKAVAFEKGHNIIVNALVIALAIVVLFTSLFAPIRLPAADFSGFAVGMSASSSDYDMDTVTVGQSIYQVLGAWGYANYADADAKFKEETEKKFQDDQKEYDEKVKEAHASWVKRHPDTTTDERNIKEIELAYEYMSDLDLFALALVIASKLNPETDAAVTMAAEIYSALSIATVVAVIHIALAVLSLVFMIFAIVGMVRKRNAPAQKFIKSSVILSGVALLLLSIAPSLVSLGGMFAVCLTSALVYLVYGIVGAIVQNKSVLHIVKRSVCTALSIISFFLLCGFILTQKTTTLNTYFSKEESTVSIVAPLGLAYSAVINILGLLEFGSTQYVYPETSAIAAILALLLFIAGAAVMFAAMMSEFNKLANDVEKSDKIRALPLIGAIILVVAAMSVGITSAVIELPDLSEITSSGSKYFVSTAYKFFADTQVYVSLGFAVASVVFGALLVPKSKPAVVANA